jgi:CheY-like chemotaxis protein
VVTCAFQTTRSIARRLGLAGYLVKPVAREALGSVLRTVSPGEARSVLVADDDPEMVRLLARMVQSWSPDCEVWAAQDGAECLEMLRDRKPDVLLLDLLMPVVDGYEVLKRMRADESLRGIPVVVITARGREDEAVVASTLVVEWWGDLSVGEAMRCLRASLDALLDGAAGSAPGLRAGPPG